MDLSIISKYRGELMGIGILEVMLLHYFTLQNIPVPGFVSPLVGLVYVQGFLFLSGFGLYYSYTNNSNCAQFFRKRFVNILIPYLLIALPYYTYFFLTNQQDLIPVYSSSIEHVNSILTYLGRISTLGYWYEGNFNGMWYLALTLLLYAVYPVAYKTFKNVALGGGKSLYLWLLIIAFTAFLYNIVGFISPRYCEVISLSLGNAYMFFVGMLFGKWSYYKENLDIDKLFVIGILCWIAPHFKSIMSMIIICYVLSKLPQTFNYITKILRWFGQYTLEIYVLHLTLMSLFIIYESKIQLSFNLQIFIAYSASLLLAVVVKRITERLKKILI